MTGPLEVLLDLIFPPKCVFCRKLLRKGEDGICKILVGKEHRNILGVHMLGNSSSEAIWGAALMIEQELRVKDVKEIIFPHPTVSEIIRETIWEFKD